jgi:hypothetical protein
MQRQEVQGVRFLFLVGGFAESPMLQRAAQNALGQTCRIIIPQDVGLTILKGAVLFGLDPTVVRVHTHRQTLWYAHTVVRTHTSWYAHTHRGTHSHTVVRTHTHTHRLV